MASQIESIRASLIGSYYTRFSIGSGIDFHFDEFVLSSYEMVSSEEPSINAALAGALKDAAQSPAWDCVAKSVLAAACIGTPVSSVDLLHDSSLVIAFSNNLTIRLPTDTPVVDWHWAITESGGDPYCGCHVACFAPGDVQGTMPNYSLKRTNQSLRD